VGENTARDWSDIARRINVDRNSRVQYSTQIARQLSWLIATGVLEADSYLPVIADLAHHLGVNVHTVRAAYRQLADDGLISMRRGTRTTVLGYDRQRAWAGTDRHSSFTIGVLVPAFTDYYADFLEAVSNAAEVEGWLPVICQTHHHNPQVISRYMDQLFSRNVDGIIVIHFETPGDTEAVSVFESSAALRPLVFVDSAPVGTNSQIVVDRTAGGYEAVHHLIGHGHRRIGYLAPPVDWSSSVLLGDGYARALAEVDIEFDGDLTAHTTDFSLEAGAKGAARLLQQQEPPTAIFCAGDILALGAIRACNELGLSVPDDVAIMGYGEIPFASLAAPSLSTIRMPADQLGYEAIRTLRRTIDEGSPQPPVAVETTLIPRRSCDCPPDHGLSPARPIRKEQP
jgi:DNA-binding LacI/PurR family transcriptional regulator